MAVNSVTTSNVRWYDGDSTQDGCGLGKTTSSKVGFYGTTPAVQPASASQAVFTVTAITALATTTLSAANTNVVHGFANETVANLYVTRIQQMQVDVEGLGVLMNQVRSELVTLGLISGAA